MRLAFAGTPDFAATCLTALVERGFPVAVVLTQPDRPAGRGQSLRASPVKQRALELGLPVAQPVRLATPEQRAALVAAEADLLVVAAYGLLLPRAVLDLPRFGCLNVHASLLPRWRGAAPVQHAILAGDGTTGITLMRMDEGLDTGPMLAHAALDIAPDDTAGTLTARLAALGARLLVDFLSDTSPDRWRDVAQDAALATRAPRIVRDQARLDWRRDAACLARQVRAMHPAPVAWTVDATGAELRVHRARALETPAHADPGTVLAVSDAGIEVATGGGRLCLDEIQAPGRKPMSVRDFLHGRTLSAGATFRSPG